MRNVYDQYDHPENRLTHALACSLAEDTRLLRGFLREVARCRAPRQSRLAVVEQALPGEVEMRDEEPERRGLPDAWIHDGERWCLLLESKVGSRATADQLRRHMRTAARRGFDDARLLLLAPMASKVPLPRGCSIATWSEVYRWAQRHRSASEWADRLADYMAVAETRMTDSGYLKEGALTEFSGIPFGEDEPYNYPEAKRTLRLAMEALCKRRSLERRALAKLSAPGRPAITGSTAGAVWDFIPLRGAPAGSCTGR